MGRSRDRGERRRDVQDDSVGERWFRNADHAFDITGRLLHLAPCLVLVVPRKEA